MYLHPIAPSKFIILTIPSPPQACLSIYNFLTRVHDASTLALSGPNLTLFLTELSIGLRTQLLDHFKKFQVSATGALIVGKDLTKYRELLRRWPLEGSFLSSLDILTEISQLFQIGPEALRDKLRGAGALVGVGKENLRPYVMRREDAGSVGIQSVLNSL